MQNGKNNKVIVWWLMSGVLLILAMVVIGGITRLTGSGLSIVEWNVISGTLPPLSQEAWVIAFEKYKQFPEYQKINYSMTLDGFKQIFWWEYLHRLLGRVMGVVFIVPFLYFWFKNMLSGWLKKRLLLILALGMAQGLMGWLMVKSGLVDNPHVSHYRLAAHLCLALTLIFVILWTVADLALPRTYSAATAKVAGPAKTVLILIIVQLILGAFVAGLKAGFSYNTYPLMNGELLPAHTYTSLTWANFMENGVLMQFVHRWFAIVALAAVVWLWVKAKALKVKGTASLLINLVLLTTLVQVVLGVVTLLLAVPVGLGVAHQLVAVVLASLTLVLLQQAKIAAHVPKLAKV